MINIDRKLLFYSEYRWVNCPISSFSVYLFLFPTTTGHYCNIFSITNFMYGLLKRALSGAFYCFVSLNAVLPDVFQVGSAEKLSYERKYWNSDLNF